MAEICKVTALTEYKHQFYYLNVMITDTIRRIIDIVFSSIAILFLLPLFLVISFLVYMTSPGGVFYFSERVGKNGKIFWLCKFRSMVVNADKIGSKNVGHTDMRVTTIGRFLRTTKLDEIPQFFNILLGDITLVGPRPDIPYYVEQYAHSVSDLVLSIKPGITDWASLVNFDQYKKFAQSENPDHYFETVLRPLKIELQIYYCNNRSLVSDWYIVFATAMRMIGISLPFPRDITNIVKRMTSENH